MAKPEKIFDDIEDIQKEMAYPEAILYKRKVLFIYFDAIEYLATYNMLTSGRKHSSDLPPRAIFDNHRKLQACVLGLYMAVRIKMRAKEKKKLIGLDDYINNAELMKIKELNRYLQILGEMIERIGITKIEKKVFEPSEAVLEE